jgi:hypothetical protein
VTIAGAVIASKPDADGDNDAAGAARRGELDAESRDVAGTLRAIGDAEPRGVSVDARHAATGSAISSTASALILLLLRMAGV